MDLCIHLLRLRPSAQQWRSWNRDLPEANITKTLEICGWTAFLRELTPPSTLGGLASNDKLDYMRKILEELYEVAEKEESFLRGECG